MAVPVGKNLLCLLPHPVLVQVYVRVMQYSQVSKTPLRGLNDTLPLERWEAEPYQTVMDGVRMLSMMDL